MHTLHTAHLRGYRDWILTIVCVTVSRFLRIFSSAVALISAFSKGDALRLPCVADGLNHQHTLFSIPVLQRAWVFVMHVVLISQLSLARPSSPYLSFVRVPLAPPLVCSCRSIQLILLHLTVAPPLLRVRSLSRFPVSISDCHCSSDKEYYSQMDFYNQPNDAHRGVLANDSDGRLLPDQSA